MDISFLYYLDVPDSILYILALCIYEYVTYSNPQKRIWDFFVKGVLNEKISFCKFCAVMCVDFILHARQNVTLIKWRNEKYGLLG